MRIRIIISISIIFVTTLGFAETASADSQNSCSELKASFKQTDAEANAARIKFEADQQTFESADASARKYVNRLVSGGRPIGQVITRAEAKWKELLSAADPYVESSSDYLTKLETSCVSWKALNANSCASAEEFPSRFYHPCKSKVNQDQDHEHALLIRDRVNEGSQEYFNLVGLE